MNKRAHIWVSGVVQGVFFRRSTQVEAERLGLAGWVRNLADGRVEAVAEGEETSVEQWVAWCRSGPPGARVVDMRIEWEEPRDETGFRLLPTA